MKLLPLAICALLCCGVAVGGSLLLVGLAEPVLTFGLACLITGGIACIAPLVFERTDP